MNKLMRKRLILQNFERCALHPDEIPFLNAILRAPKDDAPRLVYADWLEDRGDLRAEYLRLDLEHYDLHVNGQRSLELENKIRSMRDSLDPSWINVIFHSRIQHENGHIKVVSLRDGQGLIEVLGGESETALLVDGKPIAFNWDDSLGSVGQYVVAKRPVTHLIDICGSFDSEVLAQRLEETMAPLLSAFVNGFYVINFTPSKVMRLTGQHCERIVATSELQNYYPFGRTLVATQPESSLSAERVEFFRKKISIKERPVVVTASAEGAWCEFVIDGHHKLEAYHQEHVPPSVMMIERLYPAPISLAMGIGFLPSGHPGVMEYERMKRDDN